MQFRPTPLQLELQRLADEGKQEEMTNLCRAVARDLMEGERGQFLLAGLRTLEAGYYQKMLGSTDPAIINRLVGAMSALGDLRQYLTALLPDGQGIDQDEAEEEHIDYDSPFQVRAYEEP